MEISPTPDAPSLPKPSENQAYMHVSAMQAGIIHIPVDLIMQGEPRTMRACPSLSFYLKHSASDRHLIFDLGLRRDFASYSPAVQAHYRTLMPTEVPPGQSVAESCAKGGLDPAAIEMVVISHLHFDHIGDHTPFASAKFILGGRGRASIADGYPGNPTSHYLTDSAPAGRTVFLDDDAFSTSVGPFPRAHDLLGDGSVFIIDTPGHCPGHINLLARTSPDGSWVYLGGDVGHDTRLITEPERKIATTAESGAPYCMHHDAAQAAHDISRVRALVQREPRVEFIIAHDWRWAEAHSGSAFLPGKLVPKS
ncbi:beta-lactamase-like protein [Mycena latifolia]|nr:beta-lactamase-like protein [Mycena latifolia]